MREVQTMAPALTMGLCGLSAIKKTSVIIERSRTRKREDDEDNILVLTTSQLGDS